MSGNLSVVAFEGELNAIVKEYLDFGGFDSTFTEFDRECRTKNKPLAKMDKKAHGDEKRVMAQGQMMEFYHEGKGDLFFKLWKEYLPKDIQDSDQVCQKLEFYLNIHFTIYPIKYNQSETETGETMAGFKKFIETRGSSLSQTTEFLPFYALPFVPDPKTHPSYRELFTESWSKDLEARVDKFLALSLKSINHPKLFDLYNRGGGGDGKSLGDLSIGYYQQLAADAERKTLTYIRRHNKVQSDYHNLIGITADLVDALEATVQGKPITPEYLQQICARLFSSHVHTSLDLTRPGTAGEVLRASVAPQRMQSKTEVEAFPPLDYTKLKSELQEADNHKKALILQALRWRLTQSLAGKRDQIIADYIANDILGCSNTGPFRKFIMDMLKSGTDAVKQYLARLYNASASLCAGRAYLAMNPDLLPALMDALRSRDGEKIDHVGQEMVLGALQKLSLRRSLQTAMIDHGVIEWLISVLEDNDSLSDYTLEYSVALLMNLCLRTAGKKRCVPTAHQTLKVLSDLLGHENQEIRPYVNGALYSILAIPSIRDQAKTMDMEEILRCFIKDNQPDMNRQIEFIIKQLNSSENGEDYESDDEEEDDEEDEDQDSLESDLDKDEIVRPQPGELVGEALLTAHFLLTAPPGTSRGRKKTNDAAQQQDHPLQRPVTPGQRRGNESVREAMVSRLALSRAGNAPAGSQPVTGSKDMNSRPPTRSGSRPASQESVGKGYGVRPPSQQSERATRPSTKAMEKLGTGANVHEYKQAFGSKPKIPRTPDPSGGSRSSTRSSVKDIPPPQPQYSQSEPRPTSSGKSAPGSPRKNSQTGVGSQPQNRSGSKAQSPTA